jgi:hypothetical protein
MMVTFRENDLAFQLATGRTFLGIFGLERA